MTKRARYDGPYDEVAVFDPEHEDGVYAGPVAVVKKGAWLPEDVRAPIRDELIATGYWSEVKQADTAKKADEKPAEKDEVHDTQSTKKADS